MLVLLMFTKKLNGRVATGGMIFIPCYEGSLNMNHNF
jgi:hypothetical protein